MDSGWEQSAEAWIAGLGDEGDWTRVHVLDRPMLARINAGSFRRALDVGCGEGRFCRLLRSHGIETVGLDPTVRLIEEARRRDHGGDYRLGVAEALPFADMNFDLVVSYLSLIDIPALADAVAEMVRVLASGGTLLIANLASFATTPSIPAGGRRWVRDADGERLHFRMDHYLENAAVREVWADGGIDIVNHHRPLSTYMQLFLEQGLRLVHFDEPRAIGGDPARVDAYNRVPYCLVMEWRKD